jgi:anti-sigma factor RsiW
VTAKPTPTCRHLLERVSLYLDGELPAMECHEIERHCRECADCAGVVDGLRRTIGLCRQVGQAPLPADVRERARAHVRHLLAAGAAGAQRVK